jgi:hypothetical protein
VRFASNSSIGAFIGGCWTVTKSIEFQRGTSYDTRKANRSFHAPTLGKTQPASLTASGRDAMCEVRSREQVRERATAYRMREHTELHRALLQSELEDSAEVVRRPRKSKAADH